MKAESLPSTLDPNVLICCCKFSSRSSNNPRNDSNSVKCNSLKYCFASLAAFPEKDPMLLIVSILSFISSNWDRIAAKASCSYLNNEITLWHKSNRTATDELFQSYVNSKQKKHTVHMLLQ